MSEVADFIKVIIEKTGFKTFLCSIAVSLTADKLWINDWVWSIVVFCCCYLFISFAIWLYESCITKCKEAEEKARKTKEAKEKEEIRKKRLCVIYNSLPTEIKQDLKNLYKLSPQTLSNVRILDCFPYQDRLLCSCNQVEKQHHVISVEKGINSYIITIEESFCEILAEHVGIKK